MPRDLFDGDDDESSALTVNSRFARQFEERERKKLLAQASARGYDDEDDDSDDSSSDEERRAEIERELADPALDAGIARTISAIRRRDPRIYDSSVHFFDEKQPQATAAGEPAGAKEKKKPLRFKDVVREHILAADGDAARAVESDDDADERATHREDRQRSLAYDQEQQALRSELMASMHDDENDDDDDDDDDGDKARAKEKRGMLKVARRGQTRAGPDTTLTAAVKDMDSALAAKSKASTARADDAEGGATADRFLSDYLLNRRWVEQADDKDEDDDDEEDEFDDDADAFESRYNFRFEEAEAMAAKQSEQGIPGSDLIVTHARSSAGLARREDDKRKKARKVRLERKAVERKRKEDELRHLKNLKREQIQAQLSRIDSVAGGADAKSMALRAALEGDFDPATFDSKMAETFGDEYYGAEDDWDPTAAGEEDEEAWHGGDDEAVAWDVEEDEGADEDEADEGGQQHEEEGKLMDELYGLDYEDMIGDMTCRFKYRQVAPNDYGLSTDDIINTEDGNLAKLVSLKKLVSGATSCKRLRSPRPRSKCDPLLSPPRPASSQAPYHDYEPTVTSKRRHRWRQGLAKDASEAQQQHSKKPPRANADDGADGKRPAAKKERRQSEAATAAAEPAATAPSAAADAKSERAAGAGLVRKRGRKRRAKADGVADGDVRADDDAPPSMPPTRPPARSAEAARPAKKKRKKPAQSIPGVSAGRLASYGL